MSVSQTSKDSEIRPCLDDPQMQQDSSDQPTGSPGAPMADLLAKVPSMALLAAAFFAAVPDAIPYVLGKPM
jgi:hypothetical protein